jgi:hypothetical protein
MSGPEWEVPLTTVEVSEPDIQAVMECLESGWLTMGPRTAAFERRLAEFVGTPHAAAVSSGTAALHLACLAAGIGPGDEVIVPAFTFVASAAAPRYAGAEPVLCDVAQPARVQPRPGGRGAPHHAEDAGCDRGSLLRLSGPDPRAAGAVRRAWPDADRGLRTGDRRADRRLGPPGRHGGRAGGLQLLLKEAALRRRGRHGHDRRR